MALKLYDTGEIPTESYMLRLVALIYFPTIMMVVDYVLLYFQLYTMFI